ncbi:MAG: hypothetical protein IKZ04_04090 [Spirochaetaceae bacterium]|nr:hypothetical protein [Spirochaetaceae bacterium]
MYSFAAMPVKVQFHHWPVQKQPVEQLFPAVLPGQKVQQPVQTYAVLLQKLMK